MDKLDIERFTREELREYLDCVLWQFRLTDAFWFIRTEERHGLAEAERLNEEVWTRIGELGARDILKRFGPFEPGVRGVWRAYAHFPWSLMVDYGVSEAPDGSLLVEVRSCPPQEGRKRHGKGEYVCKHMHGEEMRAFARVIDPRVRVDCLFAPPDEHPADCYCRWRFWVEEEANDALTQLGKGQED